MTFLDIKENDITFGVFSYILHEKSEESAEKYENKNKKWVIVWNWNKTTKRTAGLCTTKRLSVIIRQKSDQR